MPISLKQFLKFAFLLVGVIFYKDNATADDLKNLGKAPKIVGTSDLGKEIIFDPSTVNHEKIILINFFFASCQGPCPIIMNKIKLMLSEIHCPNLQIYSISVDPDSDTPEALSKYRKKLEFDDPRWTLLNIPKIDLPSLIRDGFKLGSGGDLLSHTNRIVLIDKHNQIRLMKDGLDAETINILKGSVNNLCPK